MPAARRGRPAAGAARLDAGRIVAAALAAVESGRSDFSMRGVAAALGVDPMALYHYFPGKQALAEAVLDHAFAPLERLPRRFARSDDPLERLRMLAESYLRCVVVLPRLTRMLARQGGAPVAARFAALYALALGPAAQWPSATLARDLLVDYLHGAALAGPRHAVRALSAAWPLLQELVRPVLTPPPHRP